MKTGKGLLGAMVGVAAVFAGACSSDLCQQEAASNQGMASKAQQCNQANDGGFQFTYRTTNVQACESGVGNCSANDQQKLQAYWNCRSNIAACTPSTSFSFGLADLGCLQPLGGLSGACASAINQ